MIIVSFALFAISSTAIAADGGNKTASGAVPIGLGPMFRAAACQNRRRSPALTLRGAPGA